MDLYKVIIADDEAEIREGIIRKIDWAKYGFQVIGSAENGKEALDLAEKLQPDVMMTDIMMPFMDGLELGKALRKKIPSTKLIVFSGSDDLEYAHKAISINVVEYVLKPVNAEDMGKILTKLKLSLDERYESMRNLENLRQHYMDSLPVIREQFLVSLLEGRVTQEQFNRSAAMAGINVDATGFIVCLIQIEKGVLEESVENIFKNHDDALIPITIKHLVDDEIRKYCDFTSFFYGDIIAIIVNARSREEIYDLISGIDEVCRESQKIYGLVTSGGISLMCYEPQTLRYARKEAQSALDYRLVLGSGRAIYIGDVEPDTSVLLQFKGQDEHAIVTAIKMGKKEDIIENIEEVFAKFGDTVLEIEQYRIYFMEIKISLLRLCQTYGLDLEEALGENFNNDNQLEKLGSMDNLQRWVQEISLRISNMIKSERVHTSSYMVDTAVQYVRENYADSELTVERLSEHLHVSPTYFSTIFKKETGSSFIGYLTETRLEKAVELLNTTNDKSYQIAEKVGYLEPNYFSYVFKKKFGVSPSRYRNT